jgi:hypothetical protein
MTDHSGSGMGDRGRLILDKDLPEEESRLGIGTNPVDLDEASQFTLEAELVRLSNLLEQKARSRADQKAMNDQIKTRMKQAEEDKGKLSERGIAAFQYLQSVRAKWNKRGGL